MGEVTKQRRTLVIPNVAVATYTTEWRYDSHNRLLEMVYPDEEKVKYNYNLGGQLSSVVGEKKYLYKYIDTIGYDMYEQRAYMKYGNGTETNYGYSTNRRRLSSLDVASPKYEGKIMANSYQYDNMDNITSLVNNVTARSVAGTNRSIGGYTSHAYDYDKWCRLTKADGEFKTGNKAAQYHLTMAYDKFYNVTSKRLDLEQENLQFEGKLSTGHEFSYHYEEDNSFKLLSVNTKEYSTDDSLRTDTVQRVNLYDFDANGNQTLVAVNAVEDSACLADTAGMEVRQLLWDEENRLLAINDNGFVSNYFYDANGERTVKLSKPDLAVFVNGASTMENDSSVMKFVGYVSPYLVVTNGGRYTKHIYAGTQRIASKLGDIEAFGADPRRVEQAGADIRSIDFGSKYAAQNDSLSGRYDQLGVENKPKVNDDYVNGKSFCCGDEKLDEMAQNPSHETEKAEFEGNLYFYHPDHLGSTSLVTNSYGEITQNISYIPYGEIFVEETSGGWQSPYYFNAKELD
ncbi:MAG: type IV secretion protein Rhs, partial [Paludibacteraceae bacterium]|nr:type IV secretion protein Rhs [Paludibacteraceae bacterium]